VQRPKRGMLEKLMGGEKGGLGCEALSHGQSYHFDGNRRILKVSLRSLRRKRAGKLQFSGPKCSKIPIPPRA
ncbi:MAG: hypothetical protein RIA08_09370, partial [Roseovarius sp.]|uniref:hypothetical protein n=1 Tax=Roseobacteraceae TaxID=2854170 RepID=UPI0032EF9E0D